MHLDSASQLDRQVVSDASTSITGHESFQVLKQRIAELEAQNADLVASNKALMASNEVEVSGQILEDIEDYVMRWEMPSGKITYINLRYKTLLAIRHPEWDQKNLFDSIRPEKLDEVRRKYLQLSPGQTRTDVIEKHFPEGDPIYLSSLIRTVGTKDGRVAELQWTGHDVTSSVKYQRALSSLLELDPTNEQDFTTRITHILRTGIEYFGLEYGILLKHEQAGFQLEGYFPPDKAAHRLGTRFRSKKKSVFSCVSALNCLIAEADMSKGPYADYTFATKADCTTFIGMPVQLKGKPYGIIGFYCKSGKYHAGFSDMEQNFMRLIARWVGFKLEERRHIASLARNEAELQFIFDNMPARIWYKDDQNGIVRLNQRAAESMELSVAEATGASTYDLFPEMAKKYHEDDLQVLESGEPLMNIVEAYTPKDGTHGWSSTDKIPFTHPETGERRLLVASRDITGLKEQESQLLALNAALDNQKQHYRDLYRKTPVMMHSFNDKGEIIEVSNQWIKVLGYARREVIGKKPTDFMTEESKRLFPQRVKALWETGSVDSLPFEFIRKDGSIIEIEVSGLIDRSLEGKLRSLGVLIDVTDRNRARRELQEKNKDLEQALERVSQFAYVASHDLQEPLRKIKLFSEFLSEDFSSALGEEGQKFLTTIMDSADRMSSLIKALLEYSRTTDGELSKEVLSLDQIVKDVETELEGRIKKTSALINSHNLGEIIGDPVFVRQLVFNLIGNAIKYRHKDRAPQIDIDIQDEGENLTLTVADNGIGIEEDYLDIVFNPFTRVENGSGKKGSGIGLAICKAVCDRHGWTIRAQSKAGTGTSFLIKIPMT